MLMHTSMDTCVGTGYFTYSQSHKLALRVTWTHTPTHYTTPSFLPLGSVLLSPPAAQPSLCAGNHIRPNPGALFWLPITLS